MSSTIIPNPNGPPPKFPTSNLNPGPETPDDWAQFIRWLLLFWRNYQSTSQATPVQQQIPSPLPYEVLRPEPNYVSLVLAYVGPNQQTDYLPIPFPASRVPIVLNWTAVIPPQLAPALVDIQTSPDLQTWTSILNQVLTLPVGAKKGTSVSLFAPGAMLAPGQYVRAIGVVGTDQYAQQLHLELTVL